LPQQIAFTIILAKNVFGFGLNQQQDQARWSTRLHSLFQRCVPFEDIANTALMTALVRSYASESTSSGSVGASQDKGPGQDDSKMNPSTTTPGGDKTAEQQEDANQKVKAKGGDGHPTGDMTDSPSPASPGAGKGDPNQQGLGNPGR